MENNSASPTSPDSPIPFAPESFRAWPSIATALGAVAVTLLVAGCAIVAYLLITHGDIGGLLHPSVAFVLLAQAAMDLGVVVFLVFALPALARTSLTALGFRKPTASNVGIAVAGALLMIVLVDGMGGLIDTLLHQVHQQEAIKLLLSVHNPAVKAGFAVLAVVIAPVAEEMAFRVFLFNAVRRFGGFWIGAVVSGIIFALAHADIYALLPLALGGIVLCWVYSTSKNAWMSMITHAIFNGVSVGLLFIAPQLAK